MSHNDDFYDFDKITCPECLNEREDFYNTGFLYCDCCGHCTHPVVEDGKCKYCKKEEASTEINALTGL